MRLWELFNDVPRSTRLNEFGGKVVKNVNTTCDVQPGEIARQAAKFGNIVSDQGLPPTWTGINKTTSSMGKPNGGDDWYGKDGTRPNSTHTGDPWPDGKNVGPKNAK
jgi:hypothetical protein